MGEAEWRELAESGGQWLVALGRTLGVAPGWLALAALGLLVVAAMAFGARLALRTRKRLADRRLRKRSRRAGRAELDAVTLLRRCGYVVRDRQVERILALTVDGEPRPYRVRVDYLVSDGRGERYVAEVKSGQTAPDPTHTATRRQLLEYRLGFPEVRAILLVDVPGERVQVIGFAGRARSAA